MDNAPSLVITVPVYKPRLNLLEQFSVDRLVATAVGRVIVFCAPQGLALDYYRSRYPALRAERFDDGFFASIAGYNALLLSAAFYQRFADFDYLLVSQTDALLLKDDLDDWMRRGHDYIGAPWPHGMSLTLGAGAGGGGGAQKIQAFVGNGGFSLRAVRNSIAILRDAAALHDFWRARALNEDCFFAFAGVMTDQFSVPGAEVASRFALELEPARFYAANGDTLPTGCHAWWKYDLPFWQKAFVAHAG